MNNSPCLNCPDRHFACWDVCPRYQQYVQKIRAETAARRKQTGLNYSMGDIFYGGTGGKNYTRDKRSGRK